MKLTDKALTDRLSYGDIISLMCKQYAREHITARFIGYNTLKGSQMYGTLSAVPHVQLIEMPVAENLMVGMAVGMALQGMRPVVCFERHDFLLLALDAIVNHVDKLPFLSGNQFKLPIIIRAIVGASSPIDPGVQHRQDYSESLQKMLCNTPVFSPNNLGQFNLAWEMVGRSKSGAVVIIEYKDRWKEIPE